MTHTSLLPSPGPNTPHIQERAAPTEQPTPLFDCVSSRNGSGSDPLSPLESPLGATSRPHLAPLRAGPRASKGSQQVSVSDPYGTKPDSHPLKFLGLAAFQEPLLKPLRSRFWFRRSGCRSRSRRCRCRRRLDQIPPLRKAQASCGSNRHCRLQGNSARVNNYHPFPCRPIHTGLFWCL